MLSRRTFMSLAGIAVFACPAIAQPAQVIGVVSAVVGDATARSGERERPLVPGDVIVPGDIVQTSAAGRITLRLGAGTIIHLGAATTLRIERYLADVGGEFELVDGRMFYQNDRPATAGADRTIVRTPYGLLAVRGTRFFAGPSDGAFGVLVSKGRVDVTAAGRTAKLTPGLGTRIVRPGESPTRPAVWPPPRIREALLTTIGAAQP